MKRLFSVFLVLFISVSVGMQAVTPKISAAQNDSNIDLSSCEWKSAAGSSVSKALLAGAKALLKDIYTYSAEKPDYLPTSYTNPQNDATEYCVHASKPTHVYWGSNQIGWVSQPGGSPPGWSAIVTSAGKLSGQTIVTECFTDCSGFVTSLFTYANTQVTTQFTGWKQGSSVPEAGCFDTACQKPNPANYYGYITKPTKGMKKQFKRVTLKELAPGDILVRAEINQEKPSCTGHIMLVAAVADYESGSKLVVIIDETGNPYHGNDTRNASLFPNGGVGMGVVRLTSDSKGQIQFYWNLDPKRPAESGSIALGRAL